MSVVFLIINHLLFITHPIYPIVYTLHPALVIHTTFALRPRYSIVLLVLLFTIIDQLKHWLHRYRLISWRYSSKRVIVECFSHQLIFDISWIFSMYRQFAYILFNRILIIVYPSQCSYQNGYYCNKQPIYKLFLSLSGIVFNPDIGWQYPNMSIWHLIELLAFSLLQP